MSSKANQIDYSKFSKRERIDYSELWNKLSDLYHTTIRRHEYWSIGKVLPEIVKGKYLQHVKVINRERKLLTKVNPELLMKDTDSDTVQDALEGIQCIKRKLDLRYNKEIQEYDFDKDLFTIYYLKVVNPPKKITDFF